MLNNYCNYSFNLIRLLRLYAWSAQYITTHNLYHILCIMKQCYLGN